MIPITRKELYLNKIVGNDNYSVPEKPISEEELFFAEILGEAVQAPKPLTRYQMYLAKIAGRDIEIPYPETRLEYFLAKAAGMEIETPTPITREEIFWSNYHAIVDFEIDGVSPLTYKAIEGTLKNYCIYGNTISGESVGDLVETGEHAGEYRVPVTVTGKNLLINKAKTKTINGVKFTVNDDGSVTCNGFTNEVIRFNILPLLDSGHSDVSGNFIINGSPGVDGALMGLWVDDLALPITSEDVTYNGTVTRLFIQINENTTVNDVTFFPMIRNVNIEDGTFEPYQIPVTTNIYLPEQIKKVGEEVEYIDYKEQKQHRVRKNLFDEKYENIPDKLPIYEPIYVGDGYFTLSTTAPLNDNSAANLFLMSGDVKIGASTAKTGVWSGHKCTVESVNGYITVAYRYQYGVDPRNYNTMLNSGSEPLAYEPYIENTDLDVTLPALPTLSGTNILSIGTTVQPSKVYIKGEKEREYT